MDPGAMAFTRILGHRSSAVSRVYWASAALAVLYAANPRPAVRPIVEVMLMMLPPPECSSISGTAATVRAWAVRTLNANASFIALTLVDSSALGMVPPTLLTTMSSLPNASTALPASSAVVSGCDRSPTTTCARRPRASIWPATDSNSDWVREPITTSAPTSANATAIAAPRPRPAPVTTAT